MRIPEISFVIPFLNELNSLRAAVYSIVNDTLVQSGEIGAEVIIVSDGGGCEEFAKSICKEIPLATCIIHSENKGMCAARNSGIRASKGHYVAILDADDTLVEGWGVEWKRLLTEFPSHRFVCFSACCDQSGKSTVGHPKYCGDITFEDLLLDRRPGEYLPIFRGAYVRDSPYFDLGTRKSCGVLSYLTYARRVPIWATPRVLRRYRTGRTGSVTSTWTDEHRARETALCHDRVLSVFGEELLRLDHAAWRRRVRKTAIYHVLAGLNGGWSLWRKALSWRDPLGSLLTAAAMVVPAGLLRVLVGWAKRIGLLKRFG